MRPSIVLLYKYIPDWAKPIVSCTYRKAKFALERTKRRLRPPSLPENKNGKIYIHLGCGEINASSFINVDAIPYTHIHYVQEVNDLSSFRNEYADLVYASHVLEHIGHREVAKVLKEWRRVLKEGGTLRLSVPDFDKLIKVYSSEGKDINTIIMPLMGAQDHAYNYHKTIFNEKYFTELLLSVGFKEVRNWNPEEVELHTFEDWASRPIEIKGRKYQISLNIEAVK